MSPLARSVRWCALPLLILVAGCGVTSGSTLKAGPTPEASSTFASSRTALSTSTPSCDGAPSSLVQRLGTSDFAVVGPGLTNLAYPSMQLPEDTPQAPLLLDAHVNLLAPNVNVNPNLEPGGGYSVLLCNGSPTRSHVVTSISVRLESVAAYTGRLLAWQPCNPAYTRSGPNNGGCGGGNYMDEQVEASFPGTAPAGTTAPATLVWSGPTNAEDPSMPAYGPLPATVSAGRSILLDVGLAISAPSATYTFSVGVSLDGAPPIFSQPTTPILLAHVAQTWDGMACMSAAMQAMIPPATTPPSEYICPES